MTYKTEAVAQLAQEIKAAGFCVFISKTGTYGIYTNQEGSKVVSFQYDLGGFKFCGNYKSKSCGTGWVMEDGMSFEAMLLSVAPHWATKGQAVKCTTLDEHLATYQWSSEYTEI